MAEEIQYKRVLLKVSGEALAGDAHRGLDFNVIGEVCDVIKRCVDAGVQIGVVNFAEKGSGLQIGAINFSDQLEGFQIGAININRDSSIPVFPILNFAF